MAGAGSVSRYVFVPPSSILPPWWRRPDGSGRSLREGAWIPVSAHENDEGCAPDGGGGFRVPVRIRSPLLNPPPVVEEARRQREVSPRGAWIPVSGHGNDGGGAAPDGGGGFRVPARTSFPPSSILPP